MCTRELRRFGRCLLAAKHYLQVTDDYFEQATRGAAESGADPVQNPVQHGGESTSTEQNSAQSTNEKRPELPGDSEPCEMVQVGQRSRQESNL